MPLIALGLRDGDGPRPLLERSAVGRDELRPALSHLSAVAGVREVVLLSTCSRTEVYATVDDAAEDAALEGVTAWFRSRLGAGGHRVTGLRLPPIRGVDVASHLFEVASGLQSPVLGDRDVLGQVREAWQEASAFGAAKADLALLFRHAIVAARRVQSETGLGRARDSIPVTVADIVDSQVTAGPRRSVLVVGAGAMGAGIASALADRGVARLVVANRTLARAQEVAIGVGGQAIALDLMPQALAQMDAVCVAVGTEAPLLDRAAVARGMATRPSRPLVVVDVGMPRGVGPDVGGVPGVTSLGLQDLRRFASRAAHGRGGDVGRAGSILRDEVARYESASRCRHAAPVLAALHGWGEQVRSAELDRVRTRLDGLTADQAAAVEALTRRLVGKLLHAPTMCLRDAAGTPHADWLAELAHETRQPSPAPAAVPPQERTTCP